MSLPFRLTCCAALLLGFVSPAAAAEPSALPALTLLGAVERGLAQHPDLQLAQNRAAAAQLDVDTARGRFLPDLSASLGAAGHLDQQPPPGDNQDYRTLSLGLSSRLNLFRGFADAAALGGSRQQLDAASADLLRERQTVIFAVASRFIRAIAAGELVGVAAESLARERALLEQVEAFTRAGKRSLTDLYRQQAATAQAELDLISAQRDQEVAGLELLQAMGEEPPLAVPLAAPDASRLGTVLPPEKLETVLGRALEQRPDLLAQQLRGAAAEEQVREARAGYLPNLDLYADAGTGYTSLAGRPLDAQLGRDRGSATLGLALTVPIFDRNLTRNDVARARLGQGDAAAGLARLRQQIGVEVGAAVADYRKASLQLQVAEAQGVYARQALEASEARYRAGVEGWIDLAAARATDASARAELVRARQGLLLQGLNVGYARGDLENLLIRLLAEEPRS